MKLEAVNFDIHEMLGTIRELIMTQAAAKKIDFVQEIEVTNTWFVADKMRISQVLINLLGTASHHLDQTAADRKAQARALLLGRIPVGSLLKGTAVVFWS